MMHRVVASTAEMPIDGVDVDYIDNNGLNNCRNKPATRNDSTEPDESRTKQK